MTISDICSSAAEDKGNQTSFFRAPANQRSCQSGLFSSSSLCAEAHTGPQMQPQISPLKAGYGAQRNHPSFPRRVAAA